MAKRHAEQTSRATPFVFTGSRTGYTRDEAARLVRGTVSVSGSTDYVVAGSAPGSTLGAARQQQVRVISERTFKNLVKNAGRD